MNRLLPTTVIGSYPQPDWLIDRQRLAAHGVPRANAHDVWRVPAPYLQAAQEDATRLAIHDMEAAGIDIITDGEARRESYSNRFATALEGIDADHPGQKTNRTGKVSLVPRVVGKIRRRGPVETEDVKFLRANTDRTIKITVPGPFTMTQQALDEHYGDEEAVAMDFAAAVNEELKDLKAAGADVVQIDDPWIQAFPDAAGRYAVKALNRALDGVPGPTVVHLCFGYAALVAKSGKGKYAFLTPLADSIADQISIEAAQPNLDLGVLKDLGNKTVLLGVLNLGDNAIETPEIVAARIREGLKYLPPERLIPAPDCGMKYLTREVAFGKLKALSAGARMVREQL
jgi:5-methyltetrahydropteroyltriglutamate--homocysteine methyltransferase